MRWNEIILESRGGGLAAVWREVDASGTVTQGIAAAEESWRGGVANFGDHQAALSIQRMPGYDRYVATLRQAVVTHLGFPLMVYRSGPAEALEAFIDDPYTTEWATSLNPKTAERFANFAGHSKVPKALVAITLHDAQALIMRGKLEEQELVINTWEVTEEIRIIKRLR